MQVYNKSSRHSMSHRLLTPIRTIANLKLTKNKSKKYFVKNCFTKVNYSESVKKSEIEKFNFTNFKNPWKSSMFVFDSPRKTSRPNTRRDIRFMTNLKIRDIHSALSSLETFSQLSINSSRTVQVDQKIDNKVQTLTNNQINELYNSRCNVT